MSLMQKNIGTNEIYEEDYDTTFNDTDLGIEEDSPEFQLESSETLEDVWVIESDDDFDFM